MIERPFFIVGSERSGTTLLRLMLDHHPRLACHFEFEHAVQRVGDDGSFPDLEEFIQWLPTARSFSTSGATIDPSLDYCSLIDDFLEQKRRRDGKEFVGATVHKHFDRLLYIWPEARFLHLVRDPRDVAPSCVAMGWAGNVWGGMERWLDAERLWDAFVTRLPVAHYHELKYEDLIRDARMTLSRVCDFLGVAFDEAMFSYVETTTYDAPNPARVEPWRTRAAPRDIQLVEARSGPLLTRRGYSPSDLPRLDISARERAVLEVENRLRRRLFHIKRYGLLLYAAENVTRRLRMRSLHSLCSNRMDVIDEGFIK